MILVDLERRRTRVSLMPMLLFEWVRTKDAGTVICTDRDDGLEGASFTTECMTY